MRIAFALVTALLCAGCASSSASPNVIEGTRVHQRTEVECVASNIKPSGCTTEYDIIFITSLNTGNPLPSVDDLRAPGAGDSEF